MNWLPLLFILIIAALWFDVLVFIIKLPQFKREWKYLNMEMERASEKERRYLKGCRRKLILSAILFSTF